ncbi:MAG: serine/threonine-protein phosphatase [Crocinitomicaceae bacterium]|nr:serine/threonine-protein phosphatase [Crocinitomicaceae bacterium]
MNFGNCRSATISLNFSFASAHGEPKYVFPPSKLFAIPDCAKTTAASPTTILLAQPTCPHAALLMANFQATIRTLFKYQRFEMTFLMEELNKKVMKSTKGEKFITFFIAHYNAHTRKMKYVNAGHNQPFLLHGRKITALNEGCIGLGMLDELPYVNVGKLTLSPNTTFVLYTDGVVELENKDGEHFGVNRLIDNVKAYSTLKMEDMNNILFSKLDDWRGELNFVDDTAVFSCKFF